MNKTSPKHFKPQKRGEKPKTSKKKIYKVRNWREYNESLVNRGRVLFWITEKAMKKWQEEKKTGKRGKPKLFSDTAIETALTLQQVYHLPLRQTEGFLRDILKKLDILLKSPDYSTLSIRARSMNIQIRVRPANNELLHIVVDSTGVKVYGDGEWKVRQHGWSKHRTWKKLHIGIDEANGDIMIGEVTGNDMTDAEILEPLLNQLPERTALNQVSADGAYDKRKCYTALRNKHVPKIAIPPQHNAKIWQHGNMNADRLPRDENLRRIRQIGRKRWKVEANYHRRSLVETCMFRLKNIFGDKVQARTTPNQRTQLLLRCKALNRITMLGMPESYLVD